jgi:hypothetical protein
VAQVVLPILVDNSCRNIQPDIVRGAHWAFYPRGIELEEGELLVRLFMCAHPRLAVPAIFKMSLGVRQVRLIGRLAWLIPCSRPEKLIDLVAIEMLVQMLLLSKTIKPEQTLRAAA